MNDLFKVVRKNFIIAFKYEMHNISSLIPLIYISFLLFKNKHYEITPPLQIVSTFATVGVVYFIISNVMKKRERVRDILKSLPLKQSSTVVGFYMFSAVIILLASIAVSIFPAAQSAIEKDIKYFSSTFMINIIFNVFIFSILLPFTHRFGYSKMKTINTIVINILLPFILFSYYIHALYTRNFFTIEIEYIFNIIINNTAVLSIACLILYLVSMYISIIGVK